MMASDCSLDGHDFRSRFWVRLEMVILHHFDLLSTWLLEHRTWYKGGDEPGRDGMEIGRSDMESDGI